MLSIGEFANITGLSVKALRHYDEKAVLVPAEIDPDSGYRRYSEAQVRSGVIVQALRSAGVPLPAVGKAVRDSDAEQALEHHRQQVEIERSREDAAFGNADLVLSALRGTLPVEERSCPVQPYVARVFNVSGEDQADLDDAAANEHFAALFSALQNDGYGPSGSFWTGLREGRRSAQAEVRLCWPTQQRVPDGWGGEDTVIDELPSRKELVAKWSSDDGGNLPEGSMHPAVVALFEAIAERGVQVNSPEIRQAVVGHDEAEHSVEVSVTMTGV